MQVQQFYDYTDMLKANLQSAITIGGKLQFKDDKQYQEFLDAGLIIGSLLVNSESANVYNTSDNTIWNAVEAKVTLWGGNPQTDMNLRHLALVEILDGLSAPDDILVQIEKVRVVAKFDVVDETKIQFGDTVYVEADPFSSKLVPRWNDSSPSYRLYMKADGSDLNDGSDFDNAVKTFNRISELLPNDLGGANAYIFIHGGDYSFSTPQLLNKNNGSIFIKWVGTYANSETDESGFYAFIRNGLTSPIANDSQARLLYSSDMPVNQNLLTFKGTAEYTFDSADLSKAWNAVGYLYFDRIVIVGSETVGKESGNLLVLECKQFISDGGLSLDMKLTTARGIIVGQVSSGYIKSIKIIGGTGSASTSTATNKGAIFIWPDNESSFFIDDASFGWAAGYEPSVSGKNFEVTNVANLISNEYYGKEKGNMVIFHAGSLNYDGSGLSRTKARILRSSTNSQMEVQYDPDVIEFVDSSTAPRTTKILNSSGSVISTSVIMANELKTINNSLLQKISTTVPADADLSNKDLVFYMDETTDTLKVKYKDSGGVVQTGDIAILT